mmetsp:Transcript_25603/g.32272  ORF Transcript_25603/g.32272 Transcript_25603/m.32272 type:complete len:179 (+) Transcript_25603:151-687(+)
MKHLVANLLLVLLGLCIFTQHVLALDIESSLNSSTSSVTRVTKKKKDNENGDVKKKKKKKKKKGKALPTSSPTTPEKIFALNGKIVVKEERRDEFINVIANDQKQTLLLEPGALAFVVGRDFADPNTFYLHEQYKSYAAFEYHMSTEHFAKFAAFEDSDPYKNTTVDFYSVTNWEVYD